MDVTQQLDRFALRHPHWLERLMPLFFENQSAVLGFGEIADVPHDDLSQTNFLYRDGLLKTGYYTPKQILPILYQFNRQSTWTVGDVIEAQAYRKSGGIGYGGLNYSSDWGLVVRLMELGGVVYLNEELGKYRSWGHSEGKVDSVRFAAGLSDLLKSYRMLEESGALSAVLSEQAAVLSRAKQVKARGMVLGLLEGIGMGTIRGETLQRVKADLIELDQSWIMKLMLGFCQPFAEPVFRLVQPYARSAFRSKLGRRLRGRRPPLRSGDSGG
jgi:hypothetical protein